MELGRRRVGCGGSKRKVYAFFGFGDSGKEKGDRECLCEGEGE